ncbi:hypothetical protein Cgig2_005458 [Carnegiea gigantea]|uniref:5'-nucleotidase n=1 Tax=Carnegiea gigantea TaxID=171969 RepID=A0A9Q1QFZ0_9CARY|nr:hypothetical protein Cgig2_005458 [Carnegiea gigantea]
MVYRVLFCAKGSVSMEGIDYGEVVVGDAASLQNKIAAIRAAGPSKLQVIADFDGTLTKYNINGQRGHTSHALLQQGNREYDIKRQKLYEYYRPLEICPTIPVDEKTKLMEEWWEKTHALLVEGGLTYDDIRKSVTNARIAFREGVVGLFELLELPTREPGSLVPDDQVENHFKMKFFSVNPSSFNEKGVPVLIFSAGLADIIEEVLRQKLHRSFKNIEIVSNRMVFDDNSHLVGFKDKTIHVLNKNEHALDMAAPLHDAVGNADGPVIDFATMKKRTNVLLLGDHTGDLGMSDGLNYETRISVGFL